VTEIALPKGHRRRGLLSGLLLSYALAGLAFVLQWGRVPLSEAAHAGFFIAALAGWAVSLVLLIVQYRWRGLWSLAGAPVALSSTFGVGAVVVGCAFNANNCL
jgi:hypothetical protein